MSNLDDFIIEDGILQSYSGSKTNVKIPEGIVAIGHNAFNGCKNIKKVTLPESVTKIGINAFAGCKNLTEINIPAAVTSIGAHAFSDCKKISSIILPKDLAEIESHTFWGCENLESVVLPDGISIIQSRAFEGCINLKKINLPSDITLEYNSFLGCKGLADDQGVHIIQNILYGYYGSNSDFTVPNSITAIGASAFSYCKNLVSVTIPNGINYIGHRCFLNCENLKSIILPNTVTEIANYAFSCENLRYFYFPIKEEHFQSEAFNQSNDFFYLVAPNLSIDFLKEQKPMGWKKSMALSAAMGYLLESEKYIDFAITESYQKYVSSQKKYILPVVFKEDLPQALAVYAEIGKITAKNFDQEFMKPAMEAQATQCVAFLMDWKNKNISVSDIEKQMSKELKKDPFNVADMKKIWSYIELRNGTLELTSYKGKELHVEIPERIGKKAVSSLGKDLFNPYAARKATNVLKNIISIRVPEGVTNIGESAFSDCKNLTNIELPNSITKIGESAFMHCEQLTEFSVPKKVRAIKGWTFAHCYNLNDIRLSKSVSSISGEAFYACKKLIIHTLADSYAAKYAKANNIPLVAEGEEQI